MGLISNLVKLSIARRVFRAIFSNRRSSSQDTRGGAGPQAPPA